MFQRAVLAGSVLMAAMVSLALAPQPEPARPTAKSVVADSMKAMGGKAAWDNTHFLHFTFAGRRAHWWDKWTGLHRVEGDTKEGKHYVVLENVNTRRGTAYLDGRKLEGDEAREMVADAYADWVNDTSWLAMPYRLQSPGVDLLYAGEETVGGKAYDKLEISFGQASLTPGDNYTAYFNRETHLLDRALVQQSMPKEGPPGVWKWEGWQKYGNVLLAPHRLQVDGDRKLELGDIAVPEQLADEVFTSPAPVK